MNSDFIDLQHIKTYTLSDLVGKNLRIIEFKSDNGTITVALDLNTKLLYVIDIKPNTVTV